MKKMTNRFWSVLGIAVLILVLSFFATFPLLLRPGSYLPAFFSSDELYSISWYSWLVKNTQHPGPVVSYTDYIAYPFGVQFFSSNLIAYLWIFINVLLAVLTTPILTYNIQILMNLFLTAFLTFWFVTYLTKSKLIGLFSGIVFGFCPYFFVRSWQHLGETYLWPIPLFLLSAIRLKDDRRLAVKIIFVISLLFASINFDVIYYISVMWSAYIFFLIFHFRKNKAYIYRLFLVSFIAGIFLLPQFLPVIKGILTPINGKAPSAWNIFHRPFEDLFEQSARPLSYFLPSAAHPVFGKITESFVGTKLYGMSFTEHTLYLGWIPIILAFVAFRGWRKKPLPEDDKFCIGFFVLLAAVAWFWSQPPWWNIFGFKLYMPSFLMYKILPMFRAYCRFGVVVMFAVAVLAGFGLKFILEKYKLQRTRMFMAVLFYGLVLFEFWNWPPYKVIDVSNFPTVYSWLKEQPKNTVIAEYPLDAGSPNEIYKLYQIKHGKRIVNDTVPGTPAHEFAQQIVKLSDTHTTEILKRINVKYVLVHHQGYFKTGLVGDQEELAKIAGNSGLKLIKRYPPEECPDKKIMCIKDPGQIDLYEITPQTKIK